MTRWVPKRWIRAALGRLGYEVRKRVPDPVPIELPFIDVLDLLVRDLLESNPEPFLVQIGAHDGATEDPVHDLVCRHRLGGLFVEPQPHAFQRLMQTYRDQDKVRFENCVLGREDGSVALYVVRESAEPLPFWLHQSASLDRAVVSNALRVFRDVKGVKSIPSNYEDLIDSVMVPSLTWESLLRKHGVSVIDVLVIDTMGFDFEVIKLLPFETVRPRIIQFEHAQLSARDQRECLQYLASRGYSLARVAVDTIGCLDAKTRRWLVRRW